MSVVKWDPFKDLVNFRDTMNRMFTESGLPRRGWDEDFTTSTWVPRVDIFEKADNIVLKAELPGICKEDIEVNVENNVLTLRGERKKEKEINEEDFYRVERYYGTFTRSFTLPRTVDPEKIEAKYLDGVLQLTLPRAEEAKQKKIEIKG
jgi:HSP20 family protein